MHFAQFIQGLDNYRRKNDCPLDETVFEIVYNYLNRGK